MNTILRAIETFELNPKWIESGFLTEELCVNLLENWDHGEDQNTEHYRYGIFKYILNDVCLDEEQFNWYLLLAKLEFNTVLHASPIIDLIMHRNLSTRQKNELISQQDEFPKAAQKVIGKWLA